MVAPPTYDDERARYERVEAWLTDEERERVERRRVQHESGDRRAGYGHDLIAAIAHGHRRRSRMLIEAAMDHEALGSAYGREDQARSARHSFAMALYSLIDVSGRLGVTAEEVRSTLEQRLAAKDSSRIERLVERASP